MRSRSLGPFPKANHWREIVAQFLEPARAHQAGYIADQQITELQKVYERLPSDPWAQRAITFIVALPVASRDRNPIQALREDFGIVATGAGEQDLLAALEEYMPSESEARLAAAETVKAYLRSQLSPSLFPAEDWKPWRQADGRPFCDLARLYFSKLNEAYFLQMLPEGTTEETIRSYAHEMSLITRSFSARWFNACARFQVPEQGSINWYLGHCLGKLDLELARERSDWVEPSGNPWKRRRKSQDLRLQV